RHKQTAGPQPAADRQPVHAGHGDIEHHRGRGAALDGGKGLAAVGDRLDLVSLGRQCPREHPPDGRVVVDDEDARAHRVRVDPVGSQPGTINSTAHDDARQKGSVHRMSAAAPHKLTPRDRAERAAARVLARLSPRVTRALAGKPIVVDGLTLDPQVQLLLKALQASGPGNWSTLGHVNARAEVKRVALVNASPLPAVGRTTDLTIPGPVGAIPARRYDTAGTAHTDVRPALVFFHGGGFVFGDLDTHDELCRTLCVHADVTVIAVDYRLAPEAPFPAAVDDSLAAFRWVHANAAALGLDPDRLAVGGDSAGGNLSAVVAQQCVADGTAAPAFQLLIYPATDRELRTRSVELFSKGFFLVEEDMLWFSESYAAPWDDVRAAPLRATDVSDLPPAYITTAGFDPLRDEGEAYAAKLADAGVPVALRRHDGLVHGFASMTAVSRTSRDAVLEMAGALQMGLAAATARREATA
ncbi:MAG: esterase/lipase, partial [Solirubrobacterales bacterium]|nr:esterase/lipase [Solirubrobacterales bacterium]